MSRNFSLPEAPYQISAPFKHNFPVSIIKRFSIERKQEQFIMKENKRIARFLANVLSLSDVAEVQTYTVERTTLLSQSNLRSERPGGSRSKRKENEHQECRIKKKPFSTRKGSIDRKRDGSSDKTCTDDR
jgi:hypothetical protein